MYLLAGICLGLVLMANTAMAQVGPLTKKVQQSIESTGCVYTKFYDYTYNEMLNANKKNPKRKPSGYKILANNGEYGYYEYSSIGYYSGMGAKAQLIKENKNYLLDLTSKKGNVQVLDKKVSSRFIGEGVVPTALGFLIPTHMKNRMMLSESKAFTYKSTIEETIDGKVYQCEVYGPALPGIPERVYKIYFNNDKPTKFAHGNRLIEILEFANVVDSNLFVIPKGFKIYALVQNDTSALLRQNKIVEEY